MRATDKPRRVRAARPGRAAPGLGPRPARSRAVEPVAGKTPVPALDRGLDVLECMAARQHGLTLTEIGRALGLTTSEVQRTVAQLTLRSYLVRDARGSYRLSSKLFRLAHAYPPFRDLVARAQGPMQEFAESTSESVHLGVLDEDRLLLVAQVEGRALVRVSLQLGALQDAVSTVSGRLLLSGLSRSELDEFCRRRKLPRAERARLETRLQHIRATGHEHAESANVEGLQDLGVPVLLPGGQVIAALTSSWLPQRGAGSRIPALLGPLDRAARAVAAAYEPPGGGEA